MARRNLRLTWARWWAASKWWLLLAAALATFLLGVAGFLQYRAAARMADPSLDPLSVVDASLLSLMLFVLNSQGEADGALPWTLQFARIAAPVIAFSAAIETFLAVFREQAVRARIRRLSDHIVIGGLGRKGAMLARAFLESGEAVVGVDLDPDNGFGQTLQEAGGWFLVGDLADLETLARVHASHARAVYFVASDDGVNFDGLQALRAESQRRQPAAYVHVQSMDLVKILGLGDGHTGTRFFSVYESGARALLLEYPAFTQDAEGRLEPLDLAVVGRGELAERLILALAKAWRREEAVQDSEHRQRLRIRLVDPDADEAAALLNWEHPAIAAQVDLVPVPLALDSLAFAQATFLPGDRPFRVYLTLRNEAQSVEAAWKLARSTAGREGLVVVATAEDSGLAEILRLDEARSSIERIAAFGLLDRSGAPDLVLGGTFEVLAQNLHAFWYRQFPTGKSERWEALAKPGREAAYRSADLVAPMLLSVGYRIVRKGRDNPGPREPARLPDDVVERLAEREHARWLREGRTLRELQADAERLQPWDAIPEEVKARTREYLRALPALLQAVGFELKPIDDPWCRPAAQPTQSPPQ